jgi:DNA-binding CsgD family transcriptional regulator
MTTESSDPTSPSERAGVRAGRRARREGRIARRETYFDLMASGFSCERIAEEAKVSAATVRREVDRAIAERRLDAPERYAHLQVARLNKALRAADASIEQGDMKAIGPFCRVVAALDRYHGLSPQRPAQAPTAAPPLALPAPPLALTHAAPVPDAEPPGAAEAMEDGSAA